MTEKIALATVIYNGVENYLKDFLDSVEKQSFQNFQLILFNNGLNDVEHFLNNTPINYNIINVSEEPALARVKLIYFLKDSRFNKVIFSDSDDILDRNRVEKNISELNHTDIVVNDFDTVDANGNLIISGYLSKRLKNKLLIEKNFLKNFNIMGMTNTAANVSVFNGNYEPLNSSLKTFDWYLWNKLLQRNNKVTFSSSTKTFYRLHENNICSFGNEISEKEIIDGIEVKIHHYNEFIDFSNDYKELKNKFLLMKEKAKSKLWLSNYKNKIESMNILFPFWWEKITVN